MRELFLTLAAALTVGAPAMASADPLAPTARLLDGAVYSGERPALEPTQFFFSGQNYCWYFNGWHGPGYYWCGYAWRRGSG
jgi:hypothetical protein